MSLPSGLAKRIRPPLKAAGDAALGLATVGLLRTIRLTNRNRMADLAGRVVRTVGPRLKEHEIGRANLAAAFPEKSADEIERILRGVWDNLGRVAAEFAQIDRLQMGSDIIYTPENFARFEAVRTSGKPALVFAAHLANWELPAMVAVRMGLDATVLYRRPNNAAVGDAVTRLRQTSMGTLVPAGLDAPIKLGRVLEGGGCVAILVDQHYVKGTEVTFFGRRCTANPLIARLARQADCPIYGTRVVRLPGGHRFRSEFTDAITPARDADGRIDVAGTMQVITSVVEGWIREFPEQWLWLHRRWR
jgi:Kdo2-lipid IVA lauroyltransferase/acyltransferase